MGTMRLLEMKLQKSLMQNIVDLSEGLTDFRKDNDESDWTALTSDKVVYSEQEVTDMQSAAQTLYTKNPHAGGIIDTMVRFVIGKKAKITPLDESQEVKDYWDAFCKKNRFDKRGKEFVKKDLRDGEVFLRFFDPKGEDTVPLVRFVEPSEIVSTKARPETTYGIETEPEDIEIPLRYYRRWKDTAGNQQEEIIEAEDMLHHKILVDSNVKRGISFLVRVAKWIKGYEDWLEDRRYLNKMRTMFYLIKTVGGGTSPSSFVSTAGQDATTQTVTSGGKSKKMPPRGSVLVKTPNISYDFPDLKINASDTKDDGRAILLMIVAGSGMAEYMITGDASNANYSSTMVAESPAVKCFEDWQDIFEEPLAEIYRRVIQYGIDNKHIPAMSKRTKVIVNDAGVEETTEEVVSTSTDCTVNFATLIVRNVKEETEAYQIHRMNGWASDRTIAERLGYDFDAEQEEIERQQIKEQKPEKEPVIPPEGE